ncbi:MAG: hypothetical protein US95_C0018G0008 [Candidatus Woesebacteria bacterium GW2011_GWB1_38_5]|uniref:PA14 domain-containing protein n=1 Tax=Candidatus Woesebacteria bacterium GW2011_GWB1_38_5 TaxID=1618568 RepID=A0A0G0K7J5_9BACT|nr:MAG: hypothetical protein US95_C0018G0008 [Candidatus Woesebacteria bacterium GW2011_GWB1_38_5]
MWLLFAQTGAVIAQDIPTGKFLGSYYNGKNFESFVFTREDPLINFNWWRGSPGPGVSKDNFSVRWQGRFDFTAGDWEFAVSADDGVRVYIDGTLSLLAASERELPKIRKEYVGRKPPYCCRIF